MMKPLSINESVARAKKRWQREQLFFILGLIILLVVGSELTNHWMTDATDITNGNNRIVGQTCQDCHSNIHAVTKGVAAKGTRTLNP
jgi:hypothetical protein